MLRLNECLLGDDDGSANGACQAFLDDMLRSFLLRAKKYKENQTNIRCQLRLKDTKVKGTFMAGRGGVIILLVQRTGETHDTLLMFRASKTRTFL